MQPRPHGSDRTSHNFGNLLITVLLNIREDHDLSLLRRELAEGPREGFAELALDVVLDRIDG